MCHSAVPFQAVVGYNPALPEGQLKGMHSLKDLQENHVVYDLACWDRVVLKIRAPRFFTAGGVANFIRHQLGNRAPDTRAFLGFRNDLIDLLEVLAEDVGLKIHQFKPTEKNGGKEERAKAALSDIRASGDFTERIVLIGKAQEKTAVWKSHWNAGHCEVRRSNLMVNWYYVYFDDNDFGLCFLKICSYAPFQLKLYFNGHEYLKQQLTLRGVGFEPLANGLLSCEDPEVANEIVAELGEERIGELRDKWMSRIPNVLSEIESEYGERIMTTIDQAEVARTQIWDEPARGREFTEQSIKENVDLGRPCKSGFIFGKQHRRNGKQEKFHSRIMTYGVIAVFAIYVMRNKLKQYFKEGRGLRTEFTANNLRDLGLGNTLTQENWDSLWATGQECIDRTLQIEKLSHDPTIGREAVKKMESPLEKGGRRVSGLPRGKARTQALLEALVSASQALGRFQNRDLRSRMATLLGKNQDEITQGQMTYDLRRLRGHGIVRKLEGSNKYEATTEGLHLAIWLTRTEKKLYGNGLSGILADEPHTPTHPRIRRLRRAVERLDKEITYYLKEEQIAA